MTCFTLRCLKYFSFFILVKLLETALFFTITFGFGDALIGSLGLVGMLLVLAVITAVLYIVLGFYLYKYGVLTKAIIVTSLIINVIIYVGTLVWLDGSLLEEEQAYKNIPFSIYTAGYAFKGLVSLWLEKISFISAMMKDVGVSILSILYSHFAIIFGCAMFKRLFYLSDTS